MRIGIRLIVLSSLLLLCGCPDGLKNGTEEQLLQSCFTAIQKNDWESYARMTITSADIMQKMLGINLSPSKTKPSYLSGILKPEEMKRHREDFDRAVLGGRGFIDFKRSKFLSPGSIVWQGDAAKALEEGGIPSRTYSLWIQTPEASLDSVNLYPLFTIVCWEGKWRLLALTYIDTDPSDKASTWYLVRARDTVLR
jgi:hypothetical protein